MTHKKCARYVKFIAVEITVDIESIKCFGIFPDLVEQLGTLTSNTNLT